MTERPTFREATEAVRRIAAVVERIGQLAQMMHFAVLDAMPDEPDTPRSWEVEREDFMRRMQADA